MKRREGYRWDSYERCPNCKTMHTIDGQGRVDTRCPLDPCSIVPNYDYECIVCGATPVMPATEMCGPCSTGEAETINGNW